MAYSRRKGAACPVPADPGLIWTRVVCTSTEANTAVKVPWNNVRLSYAYCIYIPTDTAATILDAGDWEIDLELDEAGGTELMTITVASGAAAGTVYEATYVDEHACGGLSDQSTINIESDGADTVTVGAVNLYLYFEQDT